MATRPAEVRRAVMDRIMVAVGIGMALVFAIGVVLGVIAMVSMVSNRKD
jgi:hypothetical protein